MSKETSSLSVYPNPPQHYKDFEYSDTSKPIPDINLLSRVSSFMTFGKEYQLKELNFPKIQLDSNFLRFFDVSVIEAKNIPNQELFNDLTTIEGCDLLEAIQAEMKFIKRTYCELLRQTREKIEDTDLGNCLLKYSFQKVFYLISVLWQKQVCFYFNELGLY
jgi:hypothetical protein